MDKNNEKICCAAPKFIFSCSGAADVGHISDLAARQLTKIGAGNMFCLAGIGGNVEAIIEKTKSCDNILAIDGCGVDCVKKTLEDRGISDFEHLRITEFMEKGKSPVTDERVEMIVQQGEKILA